MQFDLPSSAGVCLKSQHFQEICDTTPEIPWFEIHPENYMSEGGLHHKFLSQINNHYPLSMHGVGLSLGSSNGVCKNHLVELKKLIDRYNPAQVSEHLSWSHWNHNFLNDLLPLPYTEESLNLTISNIINTQDAINRTILIENPSSYIEFNDNAYSEPEFLSLLTEKTDCYLLLDINNIFVSAQNMNFDPYTYLNEIPFKKVKEIHLAGHTVMPLIKGKTIRVDDHGSQVCEEVWKLFEYAVQLAGHRIPTLIEWDTNIPSFEILIGQATRANNAMDQALTDNRSNS